MLSVTLREISVCVYTFTVATGYLVFYAYTTTDVCKEIVEL